MLNLKRDWMLFVTGAAVAFVGFSAGVQLTRFAPTSPIAEQPRPQGHLLSLVKQGEYVALVDTSATPPVFGRWILLRSFKERWDASVPTWNVTPGETDVPFGNVK